MSMKLVENEPKYYEFIRELRNNKEVKKGFIQQKHIDFIMHHDHMRKYAKNNFGGQSGLHVEIEEIYRVFFHILITFVTSFLGSTITIFPRTL